MSSLFCNDPLCIPALGNNKRQRPNFTFSSYKFNNTHFWFQLKQLRKWIFVSKPSNQLIFEKTIYLNDDKTNRSVLYIGLNPEDEFQVYARLEQKSINDCFMLTKNELKNLMSIVNVLKNKILGDRPIPNSNIGDRYELFESEVEESFEILSIDNGRRMLLNKETLKKLIHLQEYVHHSIFLLEKDIAKSKRLFVLLLHNFCFGKTLIRACNSVWVEQRQYFFNCFTKLNCDSTTDNFTMEIALKCEYWFASCVPWFLKTLMLSENARLKTFKLGWPHSEQFVSVKEMAKCGLYFTGISDNVKCAFCSVMLHKWECNDRAVLDHFKYSSKCPFLYDHRKTSNQADIGEIGEIDKLIALLPDERGIDEVDR